MNEQTLELIELQSNLIKEMLLINLNKDFEYRFNEMEEVKELIYKLNRAKEYLIFLKNI